MSKAQIEAKKRYTISRGDDTEETSGIDMQRAIDFIDGYHQAEKDLELTWEDIYSILFAEREVLREFGYEEHSNEEVCKEVLKRFNKERKEKSSKQ